MPVQVGLLAANVLRRDLGDPNPSIRATAVTTICSLPVLAQQDAVTGRGGSGSLRPLLLRDLTGLG